ncbi:hypothetical protein ECG_01952 [Echinococcus granulosus]|nr:hypothetical protein ECG_01952 [Echinococcus granulosus]CDS15080.1 hypothetical protein EgrG_002012800 [Echinococcus granulosus]
MRIEVQNTKASLNPRDEELRLPTDVNAHGPPTYSRSVQMNSQPRMENEQRLSPFCHSSAWPMSARTSSPPIAVMPA